MKYCPQCGTEFIPGDRFCQECGYDTLLADERPVQSFENAPPEEEIEPTPEQPAPVASPSRFSEEPAVPPPTRQTSKSASNSQPERIKPASGGGKKRWIWILVAIIAVGALAAGGWYAYKTYYKGSGNEAVVADTTIFEQPSDTGLNITANEPMETEVAITQGKEETQAKAPEKPVVAPKKPEPVKEIPKQPEKPSGSKPASTAKTNTPASNQPIQVSPAKNEIGIAVQKADPGTAEKEVSVLMQVGESGKPKYKNPKNPVKFVVKKPSVITRITTDHFNDGAGSSGVGSITIKNNSGIVIGVYQATGKAGSTGVPNMKWVVTPHIRLEPGTYYITDSEPETWSKNLLGNAFILIEGYQQ